MRDRTDSLHFGPAGRYEILLQERRLLVEGEPAPIGGRAFDLLLELVSQPGVLRTKHELIESVWPGVVVEEGNLATQISTLRKVLGGDVIATIPGRGYRFTARLEGGPSAPAPLAEPEPPPAQRQLRTNLPERLPALLGRDEDLAALAVLVRDHALVTLVGPGGAGKTRLAQTFLHARADAYPHGVCWVDLATVTQPDAVPSVVAAALGLNLGSGDPLRTLCALSASLQMLVALDNAEHLVACVAALASALRSAAPGLKLLITSQVPLRLAAERVFRIGALAMPQGPLPARQALDFGAVALFAERAQAADARWRLTDDNAPAVIEVCRQLDGLALAIELAAARAPMLGAHRLASSMDDRLRLLSSSRNRVAPPRQQTLRAALEWSHAFLDETERTVFRRLSVFVGSGSLGMIQKVVADPEGDLDEWAVLDVLALLVDRSLVTVVPGDEHSEPRYRLLESPRALALERLREAGEEAAVRQRHLQAVAAWCETAWHGGHSGEVGVQAFHRNCLLDAENAREAMAQAIAAGDRVAALQIGVILLWAVDDMPAAQRLEVVEHCRAQLDDSVPASLQVRTWIHIFRAFILSRPRRALEAARMALEVVRRNDGLQGDRFLRYLACCSVANAAPRGGGGTPEVQAALAEARTLEDPRWPPHRRFWRARAEFTAADPQPASALRLGRELLALDLASGGNGYTVRTSLIDTELACGDAAAAELNGEALLEDLQASRNEVALAYARLNLVAACLALGKTGRARTVAEAGWPQGRLFDMQRFWATYLSLLAALEGRPAAAASLAGYAEAGYAASEDAPEPNEAAACARACALARTALGDLRFERLRAEGAMLAESDVAALAFATDEAP